MMEMTWSEFKKEMYEYLEGMEMISYIVFAREAIKKRNSNYKGDKVLENASIKVETEDADIYINKMFEALYNKNLKVSYSGNSVGLLNEFERRKEKLLEDGGKKIGSGFIEDIKSMDVYLDYLRQYQKEGKYSPFSYNIIDMIPTKYKQFEWSWWKELLKSNLKVEIRTEMYFDMLSKTYNPFGFIQYLEDKEEDKLVTGKLGYMLMKKYNEQVNDSYQDFSNDELRDEMNLRLIKKMIKAGVITENKL